MNDSSVKPIAVTAEMVIELAVAVESVSGKYPFLRGYHGPATPDDRPSLAYIGPNAGIVGFELCVMLAGRTAMLACRAGYTYVASDFVEEMRQLVIRIQSPRTEAVGRDLIYYWPTVAVVD